MLFYLLILILTKSICSRSVEYNGENLKRSVDTNTYDTMNVKKTVPVFKSATHFAISKQAINVYIIFIIYNIFFT